jgi:ABC-2 type transport system permease protein
MRAELTKLRSLPLPRWTLVVQAGLVLIGMVVVFFTGDDRTGDYSDAAVLTAAVGTGVGCLVLGVWMVGLEYGEKTMRRALTADPRRDRLVAAKLATVLLVVVADTVGVFAFAGLFAAGVAAINGAGWPMHDVVQGAAAFLVINTIYPTVGFAIALLSRSMAAGLTLTLVLVFVVDSALSIVPSLGDYTLGIAVEKLASAASGDSDTEIGLTGAIIAASAWLAVLLGAGWGRFRRSDVG